MIDTRNNSNGIPLRDDCQIRIKNIRDIEVNLRDKMMADFEKEKIRCVEQSVSKATREIKEEYYSQREEVVNCTIEKTKEELHNRKRKERNALECQICTNGSNYHKYKTRMKTSGERLA